MARRSASKDTAGRRAVYNGMAGRGANVRPDAGIITLQKGRYSLSASGSFIFRLCFQRSQTKMMSVQESIYHSRSNAGMLPLFPRFSVFLPAYFCREELICLDQITYQPYKSKNTYLSNYEYLTNSYLLSSKLVLGAADQNQNYIGGYLPPRTIPADVTLIHICQKVAGKNQARRQI